MARIIMHIDMDAFFASIEERENPQLKGRPIVVGADPQGGRGRGVVSTASYAARKFGIHSAMPISQAWRLCPAPQCVYLPVDMRLYEIVSERIMNTVRDCVSDVPMEQVSVDEAYVDLSNYESGIMNYGRPWEKADKLAREIKCEILKREKLTCSVGIGPNKLIAKIASDFKKPDGLTVIKTNQVQQFLDPLPVRRLPGVGPKTEAELKRKGIETVLDLRLSLSSRDELFERACGIDNTPVEQVCESKSIGHETTFNTDTHNQALLMRTIFELGDKVIEDVRREGVYFRTVTIRVRFDDFETHTSSCTLRSFAVDVTVLKREILKLLTPYLTKKRAIRLVGVRVSNLQRR